MNTPYHQIRVNSLPFPVNRADMNRCLVKNINVTFGFMQRRHIHFQNIIVQKSISPRRQKIDGHICLFAIVASSEWEAWYMRRTAIMLKLPTGTLCDTFVVPFYLTGANLKFQTRKMSKSISGVANAFSVIRSRLTEYTSLSRSPTTTKRVFFLTAHLQVANLRCITSLS